MRSRKICIIEMFSKAKGLRNVPDDVRLRSNRSSCLDGFPEIPLAPLLGGSPDIPPLFVDPQKGWPAFHFLPICIPARGLL